MRSIENFSKSKSNDAHEQCEYFFELVNK